MKTIQKWGDQIANNTQLAASMPKWYARTAVVNLETAKTEDGFLDMAKAPTYTVGEKVMFIACNDFEQALEDNTGLVYTISEVTPNNKVKFAEGMPEGSGVFFVVKFMKNSGWSLDNVNLAADEDMAMVPVTSDMLANQGEKLAALGLKSPGWYRWRRVTRVRAETEPKTYKTICELVVSMKGFKSPKPGSASGETFQPDPENPEDPSVPFDGNGDINLG